MMQPINYFFTRSKDTHREKDSNYITLFLRLTKEYDIQKSTGISRRVESVWVEIEEMELLKASKKLQTVPNGVHRYAISKEVFESLVQIADSNPRELHFITPIYQLNDFRRFVETACK